ncbi:hypothetical protein GCM10009679_76510 [Saccharothrix algeriensis]|uniref:Peptidyl-prolyl cis-trans isomerase n=1 Tax=Catellatospora bangladeshensis TaxID=310355 RepID=A0A8J3NMK3_9ACTN|nr:hypothetical protein Cba03nite_66650 [Catellatospora bangladeshensis]
MRGLVSEQVKDRAKAQPAESRKPTKAERREARVAAARAARRRKAFMAVGGTFVGVALMIGLAFLVFRDNGTDQSTASTPNASATAPAEDPNAAPTAPAANAEFPPLPAGADPALKTKPAVTKGSGDLKTLKVTTLVEGKGAPVKAGDTVTVNYVGVKYVTGEEFDASWNRSEAFTTPVGTGSVIKGWDQGLVGVKVGSRVQLDIPADLAYGDGPDSRLPGPLRFVVDVLGVSAS